MYGHAWYTMSHTIDLNMTHIYMSNYQSIVYQKKSCSLRSMKPVMRISHKYSKLNTTIFQVQQVGKIDQLFN